MDIFLKILLWIHLTALVGGGAASVAMPAIGMQLKEASPETRQKLFSVGNRISAAARGALVALLVTGPMLFWLKWNFSAPSMIWFAIKMLLLAVLLGAVIVGGTNFKRAQGGDAAAAKRAELAGRVSGLSLLGIILAAVFAFS